MKHRIVQIGLGTRGCHHLESYLALDNYYDLVGIYDPLPGLAEKVVEKYHLDPCVVYYDPERMLNVLRPEIVSFVTPPLVRKYYVELAARYNVKGLLFEKPMATNLQEARDILKIIHAHSIKAVVCHQHKYFKAYKRLHHLVFSGEIGKILRISAECKSWPSKIATHYIDYILWINGDSPVLQLAGHISGRRFLVSDHPSPEYLLSELEMANGVRATLQCGFFSKSHSSYTVDHDTGTYDMAFWTDCRLSVYGETGYACAELNGKWRVFSPQTRSVVMHGSEPGYPLEIPEAQIAYAQEMIAWLENDEKIHSCCIDRAYYGFQLLEAIYRSAMEFQCIKLPLEAKYFKTNTIEDLRKTLNA